MKKFNIKQEYWFRNRAIALGFPQGWRVDFCPMGGDAKKELSLKDIKKAIDNPIGSKNIEEIAKNKKEVVILFDDMTRPTRPYKVIPYILEKLESAGIKKNSIRFIVASGTHGACRLDDFRKKLGSPIVENYRVYNHNSFENCEYAGKTSTGIELFLNKEFLKCDLKIGIGSILPHLYCGFSGGGKIVLPGISHIKTIDKFHSQIVQINGFKKNPENVAIKSMNDAVKLTDFQFKIDFIFNSLGKEIGCFAGNPIFSYKEGIREAKKAYATRHGKDYDVIIANAYFKSNEADIGLFNVSKLISKKGGIIILAAHNPQGQINHYLFKSYGKFISGRQFKIRTYLNPKIKYIIFSPFKDYNSFDTFDKPENLIWQDNWQGILDIIKDNFSKPKIAIFPEATTQLLM